MVFRTKCSEWVSPAHPDRMADCIAAKLIDRIYKENGLDGHAAIEVAIFGNNVLIGGEVTSPKFEFTNENIDPIVKEVISEIGYNEKLREWFDSSQVYIASDYEIKIMVNNQSEDIADLTTNKVLEDKGWNDQGTYVGYASNATINKMSLEHYLASSLGKFIYNHVILDSMGYGLDIKTLASVEYKDGEVNELDSLIIAIPCVLVEHSDHKLIKDLIMRWIDREEYNNSEEICKEAIKLFKKELTEHFDRIVTINGNGRYIKHGSLADSGLTGRKLVVNQCGNYAAGGSMIKPLLASDRLLNLFARSFAKYLVYNGYGEEITVELSAVIGDTYIHTAHITGLHKRYEYINRNLMFILRQVTPYKIISEWNLYNKNGEFASLYEAVLDNFFFSASENTPWEYTDKCAKLIYEDGLEE